MAHQRRPRVAVVGAGMSGICMGARLKLAGIDTFTIFEKSNRLGGTWRDNTYPGLSCDVPSRFYQFTFAPNPGWTHLFSPGAEIWEYLDSVAERFALDDHLRFGTEVESARWEDGLWLVQTCDGVEEFDFLVSATGILHHPRYPDITGLDSFAGAVFHSARWDHSVPLESKKVAVVGTGSTGVQIVCGLAGTASEVLMFQRTAQWILPLPNLKVPGVVSAAHRTIPGMNTFSYYAWRGVFEAFAPALTKPGLRRKAVSEMCRRNLRSVRDPELRRRLTPDYEPMCKRLVISSKFYDAVQRDDVDVVTEGIDHVEPRGIVTTDGVLHEVDVIALATGFDAHAYLRPMDLVGEGGVTLDEAWADGPKAYQTVALAGFPNFFMFMGPNSPVGNYSLTAIAETQASYVLHWVGAWQCGEVETVAPTQEATDAFYRQVRKAMPNTVWTTGCDSWYLGKDGQPELFPWTPDRHRTMLSTIRTTDFETTALSSPDAQASSPPRR
jgi:cation diffusion facilitator CzcD-associated flavoprotein CzcO